MKYLLVLGVVLVVIWYWRSSRGGTAQRKDGSGESPQPRPQPQDMVQCPVCHIHLPRTDALPGPDGRLYCCADHRLRAGD